nr:immunoglobulin heavy chain junction region [Mus musculus]
CARHGSSPYYYAMDYW